MAYAIIILCYILSWGNFF